jgi:hypothetical protein
MQAVSRLLIKRGAQRMDETTSELYRNDGYLGSIVRQATDAAPHALANMEQRQ